MDGTKRVKQIWENLKGWRTVIINILLSILPVLQLTELRNVIAPEYLPWYALAVAVINVWLRQLTTTPLGQK